MKPISIDEIKQHARKHDDDVRLIRMEKARQKVVPQKVNYNKTKFSEMVEEEERVLRERSCKEKEEKKVLQLKQQKYAEIVKTMFVPQKKRSAESKQATTAYSKSPGMREGVHFRMKQFEKQLQERIVKTSTEHMTKKHNNNNNKLPPMPVRVVKKPEDKPKQADYLQEVRMKRLEQLDKHAKSPETWDKTAKLGVQNVLINTQKWEEQAKMKEQIAYHSNDIDKEEEANNLYINSIKAKLALLD